MEMLIIAVIAILAFAAVLVPLFRRGERAVDADEFRSDEPAPGSRGPGRSTAAPAPGDGGGVDPVTGEGVVPPLAAGPATPVAATEAAPEQAPRSEDEIELEVQRYRAALRAGTICRKCGQANPADSTFCFDCGAQLPRDEAREFD
jgi:ribosomal protein L40E